MQCFVITVFSDILHQHELRAQAHASLRAQPPRALRRRCRPSGHVARCGLEATELRGHQLSRIMELACTLYILVCRMLHPHFALRAQSSRAHHATRAADGCASYACTEFAHGSPLVWMKKKKKYGQRPPMVEPVPHSGYIHVRVHLCIDRQRCR